MTLYAWIHSVPAVLILQLNAVLKHLVKLSYALHAFTVSL